MAALLTTGDLDLDDLQALFQHKPLCDSMISNPSSKGESALLVDGNAVLMGWPPVFKGDASSQLMLDCSAYMPIHIWIRFSVCVGKSSQAIYCALCLNAISVGGFPEFSCVTFCNMFCPPSPSLPVSFGNVSILAPKALFNTWPIQKRHNFLIFI